MRACLRVVLYKIAGAKVNILMHRYLPRRSVLPKMESMPTKRIIQSMHMLYPNPDFVQIWIGKMKT